MKNTIVLYSTKNEKDSLCIESMFREYDMQEIYTLNRNVNSEYTHIYTWTKKEEIEEYDERWNNIIKTMENRKASIEEISKVIIEKEENFTRQKILLEEFSRLFPSISENIS